MNDTQQLDRFYVIVRADLPPGLQAAQSVHAAIQFSQEWPDLIVPWFCDSNYLVIVSVEDEEALKLKADEARDNLIRYSIVEEPDLDDAWTAIALQPGEMARLLCSGMDLALKYAEEPKMESYDD